MIVYRLTGVSFDIAIRHSNELLSSRSTLRDKSECGRKAREKWQKEMGVSQSGNAIRFIDWQLHRVALNRPQYANDPKVLRAVYSFASRFAYVHARTIRPIEKSLLAVIVTRNGTGDFAIFDPGRFLSFGFFFSFDCPFWGDVVLESLVLQLLSVADNYNERTHLV